MKKKILLVLFAVCAFTTVQAQFSGKGSGTENDPYQITNADQLFDVRNDLSAHYRLMEDIDLTNWIAEDNPSQGWTPIGTATTPFSGTFDGNNKCILGLYINRPTMDNVGLFGFTNNSLRNIVLVNPHVIGKDYVGAISGQLSMINGATTSLDNDIVIGGKIVGENNVGGIAGGIPHPANASGNWTFTYQIQGCYTAVDIVGKTNCGGICGYTYGYDYYSYSRFWETSTFYHLNTIFSQNAAFCNIQCESNGGGIIGQADAYCTCTSNLAGGTIKGTNNIYGIAGTNANGSNIVVKNNVCAANSLELSASGNDVFRITNFLSAENNYASSGMEIIVNGNNRTLEDNSYNGIGSGNKVLKKASTYTGLGFDFDNFWTIEEGESYPYNLHQSKAGQVTEFTSGSKANISGIAPEDGKIYILIGRETHSGNVIEGKWETKLGNITSGTEIFATAVASGKAPSVLFKAIAQAPPAPPSTSGDANGDGTIDSADVTAIINYILGRPSASFNKANADINGDGEILIDDAVNTVQMIMNAQ